MFNKIGIVLFVISVLALSSYGGQSIQTQDYKGNMWDSFSVTVDSYTAMDVGEANSAVIISSSNATARKIIDWLIINDGPYDVHIDTHPQIDTSGANRAGRLKVDASLSPTGKTDVWDAGQAICGKSLTGQSVLSVFIFYEDR